MFISSINDNEKCIGKRQDSSRKNKIRICGSPVRTYCDQCGVGLCSKCKSEFKRHGKYCENR